MQQEKIGQNMPEKKFRAGAVSATIWLNKVTRDGQEQTYRTVNIERGYKDKEDKWQSTSSFREMDLPKVELVSRKAYEYLMLDTNTGDSE